MCEHRKPACEVQQSGTREIAVISYDTSEVLCQPRAVYFQVSYRRKLNGLIIKASII